MMPLCERRATYIWGLVSVWSCACDAGQRRLAVPATQSIMGRMALPNMFGTSLIVHLLQTPSLPQFLTMRSSNSRMAALSTIGRLVE